MTLARRERPHFYSVARPEHLHLGGARLRNQLLYRTQRHLDPGKQLVVERFRHALPDDAQWRAALAAIGSKQFSEEMWPCSEADNAEWQCSDITQSQDQSYSQCNVVRQLAPKGELAGAFAYHEVGIKPHTMLTWEEIDDVSSACGGCKVLLHTRMYSGLWKGGVDTVLAHPQLLGVVFERAPTSLAIADLGSFAEAMLAAESSPSFCCRSRPLGRISPA